jgi:hypothetical protein
VLNPEKFSVDFVEKIKETTHIFKDVPKIDKNLLIKTTKKNATEEDIQEIYEHIINIQTEVINNLVKKYGNEGN